ncbi:MAG TPA: efflux RND transporter periplasmic adaptor subunit [Acetobacteraceae bacterium]|nr:efflux RND transporter periplasmic adaptor subunit [Acetobacteraceae bacterium]
MRPRVPAIVLVAALFLLAAGLVPARAQTPGPPGPPSVGVAQAEPQQITETSQYVGRIQAQHRVALVARVSAFLEQRDFVEGSEVTQGQLLYKLEQPPFQADLAAKQAAVAQAQAQLQNATLAYRRAASLIKTPAGQQSLVDSARATMLSDAGQLQAAEAQVRSSQINLGYTEIHAPIAGKIGLSAVSVGNVVSPSSGTLATIVSQDPMYVVFPVSLTDELELRHRYAGAGGFGSVLIRIELPDGRVYDQTGKLDFVDNTVSTSTDTVILRGTIANPPISDLKVGGATQRELIDGEFVTVLLEGAQPISLLAIPRAAVMTDQQGDYVYTVDAQHKVVLTRVTLGQSTATVATITTGLTKDEDVIVDGLQKVRPGEVVAPGPASAPLHAAPASLSGAATAR